MRCLIYNVSFYLPSKVQNVSLALICPHGYIASCLAAFIPTMSQFEYAHMRQINTLSINFLGTGSSKEEFTTEPSHTLGSIPSTNNFIANVGFATESFNPSTRSSYTPVPQLADIRDSALVGAFEIVAC